MVSITTLLQLLLLLLPVGLAIGAVVWDCLPLIGVAALLLLIFVRVLPLCRGDEVPWMVLLAGPAGLPVNLLLVRFLWQTLWWDVPLWAQILRSLLALYVLFSVETLLLSGLAYVFRGGSQQKPSRNRRTPHV